MPKISTFIYSDDSTQTPDRLLLTNPKTIFRTPFIPSFFSFSVTFGIIEINPNEKNEFQLKIWAEEDPGEILIDTGVTPIPTELFKDKHELNEAMISLNVKNLTIKKEGKYITQVVLNKEQLGSFPMYMTKAVG